MNIITIDNVCKNYKSKKALDNVSLSIKQGELFGLLGVNGAGKTTLIKILCGLTRKTSGTITINNFNLDKDVRSLYYDLLYELPSFVFDECDDKLKQTDVTIFYKLFYPFIDYCSNYFNVLLNGDIHQENIFIIFNKLIKNKFEIIDKFIGENNFNEEEKEILLGFKRFKSGPFLIITNEPKGSIFFDRKDFYLVKGLDQSVEVALQLDPPRYAETILVPFKEQIVYFAVLKSWDGGMDPASKIRLQKSYEALRSTVIKKL